MKRKNIPAIAIMALSVYFTSCGNGSNNHNQSDYEEITTSSSSNTSPQTSSGYMSEDEYAPTVHESGEYHTIDGSANQVQYQGSKEQKSDLDAIDEYMKNNPNF